jgi:hypothetical protein
MSYDHEMLRRRIARLRRTRDHLYLKLHLGQMDAREFWDDLEERWNHLEANAKQLTRESEDALDGVASVVRGHITELREGYDRLASMLREPHSNSLWSQVRSTFDRLVEGGHRATERVVAPLTELGEAAKLRLEKARLERMLIKKCAELGTQVYQLAKGTGVLDGRPPQVLDDVQVKALLQDIGSLDADLRKATADLLEPHRAQA